MGASAASNIGTLLQNQSTNLGTAMAGRGNAQMNTLNELARLL